MCVCVCVCVCMRARALHIFLSEMMCPNGSLSGSTGKLQQSLTTQPIGESEVLQPRLEFFCSGFMHACWHLFRLIDVCVGVFVAAVRG